MPLKVFAKKFSWNPKEEEWILKNDRDDHYYNNSALPKAWSSLSYPIYDGDYYFAFIHKKARVNSQYNAKANRELRKYIKSTLSADEIFDKMEKYFSMQFKDAGSGDTMTREELWTAIVDMRQKNPVKEGLGEGKGTDIFKKHSSAINRLSDKEKDEVIELLYQMNSQSGRQYKQAFSKVKELLNMEYIPEESDLQEVALDTNMLQRQFPNVWATKDSKLYRVLWQLISQDGYMDNKKSYDKDKKKFVDDLRNIAKNPKKYEKSFGRNFAQYIEKPKKGQAFAEEKVDLMSQGWANAFGKTTQLDEAVADITVDPKNRINSGQQQAYHGMEIAKQARRMGLKSAVMHKHVRIKGAKKAVNDFLRVVIGKSRYGDPTEKDMSTPQVDKMLTKGLK